MKILLSVDKSVLWLPSGDRSALNNLKKEAEKKDISITLKYHRGSPLIKKIEKITKQGCRVYSSFEKIPKTIGGLGTTILSTSKGVMSDADARTHKVGGEVLISVF